MATSWIVFKILGKNNNIDIVPKLDKIYDVSQKIMVNIARLWHKHKNRTQCKYTKHHILVRSSSSCPKHPTDSLFSVSVTVLLKLVSDDQQPFLIGQATIA
jgi:hypothetical protein